MTFLPAWHEVPKSAENGMFGNLSKVSDEKSQRDEVDFFGDSQVPLGRSRPCPPSRQGGGDPPMVKGNLPELLKPPVSKCGLSSDG